MFYINSTLIVRYGGASSKHLVVEGISPPVKTTSAEAEAILGRVVESSTKTFGRHFSESCRVHLGLHLSPVRLRFEE